MLIIYVSALYNSKRPNNSTERLRPPIPTQVFVYKYIHTYVCIPYVGYHKFTLKQKKLKKRKKIIKIKNAK